MMDLQQSACGTGRGIPAEAVRQFFSSLQVADCPAAGDVAEGVALFFRQAQGVATHSLSLVAARSFCAVGDVKAAERVLRGTRAHREHASLWVDTLSGECGFSELYPLFSSRVLRPQHFASAGSLWVLDFARVKIQKEEAHELILYRVVRALTERTQWIWNRTGGVGALGLRGLFQLAGRTGVPGLPFRLRDHADAVMGRCAERQGWAHRPAVLLTGSAAAVNERHNPA